MPYILLLTLLVNFGSQQPPEQEDSLALTIKKVSQESKAAQPAIVAFTRLMEIEVREKEVPALLSEVEAYLDAFVELENELQPDQRTGLPIKFRNDFLKKMTGLDKALKECEKALRIPETVTANRRLGERYLYIGAKLHVLSRAKKEVEKRKQAPRAG